MDTLHTVELLACQPFPPDGTRLFAEVDKAWLFRRRCDFPSNNNQYQLTTIHDNYFTTIISQESTTETHLLGDLPRVLMSQPGVSSFYVGEKHAWHVRF